MRSWVVPSVDDVCQAIEKIATQPNLIDSDEDFIKILLSVRSEFKKISELKEKVKLLQQQLNAYKQHVIDSIPELKDIEIQMRKLYGEMETLSNSLCDNLYNWSQSEKYSDMNLIIDVSTSSTSTTQSATQSISFSDVFYKTSLTLARLNPINTNDFATSDEVDEIEPENILVTSDRYLYDMNSLETWLKNKSINPYTRGEFRLQDQKMIREFFLEKKKIAIKFTTSANSYPGNDPAHIETLALRDRLQRENMRFTNTEAPQSAPDSYAPVVQLPDLLGNNLFAQLANGYLAVATYQNRNSEILIINPANNFAVIRRIQDPEHIRAIRVLPNGNIVVGHNNDCFVRNPQDCTLNVYNPETGARVNTSPLIPMGADLIISRGNDIIFSGTSYLRGIQRYNSQTGELQDLNVEQMFMQSFAEVGNNLAVFGINEQHEPLCIVYDSEFRVINRFNYPATASRDITVLGNNKVALADISSIYIYDVINGTLTAEINISFINAIHSIATLENGNIIISGATGWIQEYTQQGDCVGEAKTNLGNIDSPLALRLAYNIIVANNALRVPAPAAPAPLTTMQTNSGTYIILMPSLLNSNTLFSRNRANIRIDSATHELHHNIRAHIASILTATRTTLYNLEYIYLGLPIDIADSAIDGAWSNKFMQLKNMIPNAFVILKSIFRFFIDELLRTQGTSQWLLTNSRETQFALAAALMVGIHTNNQAMTSLSKNLISTFHVENYVCEALDSAFTATITSTQTLTNSFTNIYDLD